MTCLAAAVLRLKRPAEAGHYVRHNEKAA